MTFTVHRYLVTGTDESLIEFSVHASAYVNAICRRGQTALYTCTNLAQEHVIHCANHANVTLQELHGAGKNETYQTIVDNGHAWKPTNPDTETVA